MEVDSARPQSHRMRTVRMTRNQRARLTSLGGASYRGAPPITFGLRFEKQVPAELIRRTLTELVQRHTALRVCFPRQLPHGWAACLDSEGAAWPLEVFDLDGLPPAERDGVRARVIEGLNEPFALDVFPLFRAYLIRSAEECSLVVGVDHIIFDGASIQVFLEDFADIYRNLDFNGSGTSSSEAGSDVAEFATQEDEWLSGPEAEAALAHWQSVLSGFDAYPGVRLPVRSRASGDKAKWAATIPAQRVLDHARSFAGGHISASALAAAAVVTALRDITGQEEIGLQYPADRRYIDGGERMIGYLNNRVLLRVAAPADETFFGIADRTRRAMLDSLEHDMLPFEVLLEKLAPQVTDRRPEHPYIHLNVETAPVPHDLPALRVQHFWPPGGSAGGSDLCISINLEVNADTMILEAGYSTARFSPATVSDLMERITGFLTGADGIPV